jgi:hypothetical protein
MGLSRPVMGLLAFFSFLSRLRGYHSIAPRPIAAGPLCTAFVVPPSSTEALQVKWHERSLVVKDGIMGEKWLTNFAVIWLVPNQIKGSFTCHKSATWDRQLCFPSEGRHAEDFFALIALADFEPMNSGTRCQPANPQTTEATIACFINHTNFAVLCPHIAKMNNLLKIMCYLISWVRIYYTGDSYRTLG